MLRDVLDDINLYTEAVKYKIRKSISRSKQDNKKDLYTSLKYWDWTTDSYLSRKMRKYKRKTMSYINNQIVIDSSNYTCFQLNKTGNIWLKIPSLTKGKRLCIPLNSTIEPKGQLRLILKNNKVEIHHCIDKEVKRPCGKQNEVGVDIGHTEVFSDSNGCFYGENFGKVQKLFSDYVKDKNQKRNKLGALSENENVSSKKRKNIRKYNLGTIKYEKKKQKYQAQIKYIVYNSIHQLVDKASVIIAEDLNFSGNRKKYSKDINRYLSAWARSHIFEGLKNISKVRGSDLRFVNAAYTSQMDSKSGKLEGKRDGDKFHHVNGDVTHADTNAAINIKNRFYDKEIERYTPYQKVKSILLSRANG